MSFFRKIKGLFHEDWCPICNEEMRLCEKQLFLLNETVSHYQEHRDANYFIKNLVKVNKKSEIPPGMYACGIKTYWCSQCGKKIVFVQVFLPVRDMEKNEDAFYFENGQLDQFLIDQR